MTDTMTPTDADVREKFEAWARLPILNLNLATYPAKKGQIGGGLVYRDPTTEIARAAWHAGIESVSTRPLAGEAVRSDSILEHAKDSVWALLFNIDNNAQGVYTIEDIRYRLKFLHDEILSSVPSAPTPPQQGETNEGVGVIYASCEACDKGNIPEDEMVFCGDVSLCPACFSEWKAEFDACDHATTETTTDWGGADVCTKCSGVVRYHDEKSALASTPSTPTPDAIDEAARPLLENILAKMEDDAAGAEACDMPELAPGYDTAIKWLKAALEQSKRKGG